jgi:integrase
MREMAKLLVRAGKASQAPVVLHEAASARSAAAFREVEVFVGELTKNVLKASAPTATLKVSELGEQCTSGELHRRYPDRIKLKRTAIDDRGRLKNYVYPVIGDMRVDAVTLDDCEEVMRRIPDSAKRSRRHIAGTLARLLRVAVYPLRLIEASPVPRDWLPAKNGRRLLAYLYPEEERRLMTAADVPLEYRLLWGFLAREGTRAGETRALTWGDIDLKRGAILEKNKSDDPRSWALDEGTACALRTYRKRFRSDVDRDDLVFVDVHSRPLEKTGLATTFRAHLSLIGLEEERPEVFTSTDER